MSLNKHRFQRESSTKRSFAQIWEALERTHDRGMHIYDEPQRSFVFTSYAQLATKAAALARRLRDLGFLPGSHVLVSAKTCPEFPVVWLALVVAGAVPVPMPPREAMLGVDTYRNWLQNIVPHFSLCLCHGEETRELEACAGLRPDFRALEISALLGTDGGSVQAPEFFPQEPDTAFIQFTSGSTSRPKGIIISYENVFANVAAIWQRLGVQPFTERFIAWAPLHHDMGLVANFLGCLFTQTELVLMPPHYFAKRPTRFMELIGEYRANYCTVPNFAVEWILKRFSPGAAPRLRLDSLKWLGVGAEPVNLSKLREFARTFAPYGLKEGAISPAYGLAEATLAVTVNAPEELFTTAVQDGQEVVLVGTPVQGVDVLIEPLTNNGAVGRVKVRGTSVARQALVEGQVMDILDEQGYYDTGDIGVFEGEQLVILGRSDEMFIINGQNYFPYDVEAAVRQLDGVLRNRVACFAIRGTREKSGPDVVVMLESKANGNNEQLRENVRRQVLDRLGLKVEAVLCVPPKAIPVTPSGKIQRTRAAREFLAGCADMDGFCGTHR